MAFLYGYRVHRIVKSIMEMYRIIARCDPYNARKHHHGEEVVERDGATPVAWVLEDGLSLDEANRKIYELACESIGFHFGPWPAICRWGAKFGVDAFSRKNTSRVLRDDSMTYSVEKK